MFTLGQLVCGQNTLHGCTSLECKRAKGSLLLSEMDIPSLKIFWVRSLSEHYKSCSKPDLSYRILWRNNHLRTRNTQHILCWYFQTLFCWFQHSFIPIKWIENLNWVQFYGLTSCLNRFKRQRFGKNTDWFQFQMLQMCKCSHSTQFLRRNTAL